jgi:hypothetical protein
VRILNYLACILELYFLHSAPFIIVQVLPEMHAEPIANLAHFSCKVFSSRANLLQTLHIFHARFSRAVQTLHILHARFFRALQTLHSFNARFFEPFAPCTFLVQGFFSSQHNFASATCKLLNLPYLICKVVYTHVTNKLYYSKLKMSIQVHVYNMCVILQHSQILLLYLCLIHM